MCQDKFLAIFSISILTATLAHADDGQAEFDQSSKVSLQQLMLTGSISSTLLNVHDGHRLQNAFYSELGLNRFKVIKESDANSEAVKQWCEMAVKDSQIQRGETDGQTGDAQVTMKAKLDCCSNVLKHSITVEHTCSRTERDDKFYMECKIDASATVHKYKVVQDGAGLKWVADTQGEWAAGKGSITVKSDSTSSMIIYNDDGEYIKAGDLFNDRVLHNARTGALNEAISVVGLFLKRGFPDFRVLSPAPATTRSK